MFGRVWLVDGSEWIFLMDEYMVYFRWVGIRRNLLWLGGSGWS